jgi:hypothetical protein
MCRLARIIRPSGLTHVRPPYPSLTHGTKPCQYTYRNWIICLLMSNAIFEALVINGCKCLLEFVETDVAILPILVYFIYLLCCPSVWISLTMWYLEIKVQQRPYLLELDHMLTPVKCNIWVIESLVIFHVIKGMFVSAYRLYNLDYNWDYIIWMWMFDNLDY